MQRQDLVALARLGARVRIERLEAEIKRLRAFNQDQAGTPKRPKAKMAKANGRHWSLAARRAASQRMKAAWAKRRASGR